MPDWIIALLNDIKVSRELLQAVDFALPSFICLWFMIVLLPLKGMDRRDPIAGAVYTMFCMGAGVVLMFALPKEYIPNPSLGVQVISVFLMGVVAAFRWGYGANEMLLAHELMLKEKKRKKEDGEAQ